MSHVYFAAAPFSRCESWLLWAASREQALPQCPFNADSREYWNARVYERLAGQLAVCSGARSIRMRQAAAPHTHILRRRDILFLSRGSCTRWGVFVFPSIRTAASLEGELAGRVCAFCFCESENKGTNWYWLAWKRAAKLWAYAEYCHEMKNIEN